MPSIAESLNSQSQLQDTLAAGLNTLSQNQTVTFTVYQRTVLPLDGYIFYLNTGVTQTVQGSIHFAIDREQNEDATIDIDHVTFTALSEIDIFNQTSPDTLYIGEFEGLQFSFRKRDNFYQQANLYHYSGHAVYSVMQSQLIDNMSDLPTEPIVSNSLPVWLTLNKYMPMYPSFVVPDNIAPPYATIHIGDDDTEAIGSAPFLDYNSNHTQLASDRVRLTIYGLNNQQALDFQDYVFNYILMNDNTIGLQNMPIVKDAKRTQVDLTTLAMKKTMDFKVSYYQTRMNDVARQLIETVLTTYYFNKLAT